MMQRSCASGSSAGAYCCTRRLTADDDSFCAEGQPCSRDEQLAKKDAAAAALAANVAAVFDCARLPGAGKPCGDDMEAVIERLVEQQVAMQQKLATVSMPRALSQAERALLTRYVQQVDDTAREMRSLSHTLSVEVSRAAEFAHAFSRTLEGAALLETG